MGADWLGKNMENVNIETSDCPAHDHFMHMYLHTAYTTSVSLISEPPIVEFWKEILRNKIGLTRGRAEVHGPNGSYCSNIEHVGLIFFLFSKAHVCHVFRFSPKLKMMKTFFFSKEKKKLFRMAKKLKIRFFWNSFLWGNSFIRTWWKKEKITCTYENI